jgi:hypothetical protein
MSLSRIGFVLFLSACAAACSKPDREAHEASATPAAAPATPAPAATAPPPVPPANVRGVTRTASGQVVSGNDYRQSAENALLDGHGAIRSDVAQATLDTGRFDLSLLYMAEQTAHNREAQDLTEAYANHIRGQLASTPQAQLDILQCGDTICLGRIRTDDPDVFQKWRAQFDKDSNTPHYAWLDSLVRMDSGVLEHRFVFSTDPSVASLRASEPQTRSQR